MALDEGERAAISLAAAINADLILIDDRAGATVARRRGRSFGLRPGGRFASSHRPPFGLDVGA